MTLPYVKTTPPPHDQLTPTANSPSPSYPLPSQVSTHPLDVDASKNSYTLVKVCFVKSLTKASLSLYYQTPKIHKNILKTIFCWRQSLILPGHAMKGPGFVYYWTIPAGLDTKNRNCAWMFPTRHFNAGKKGTAKFIHLRINTQARIISWCYSDYAVTGKQT